MSSWRVVLKMRWKQVRDTLWAGPSNAHPKKPLFSHDGTFL